MKRCFDFALDLLFPRSCVHCGNPVEGSPYRFVCGRCAPSLIECLPPACRTCGYPFYGAVVSAKTCLHCNELNPVFDQGKTLFIAKGVGRSLLHELKYRRGMYVLDDIARIVTHSLHYLEYIRNAILVPVPLHPVKLRERGFNQSEKIARMLIKTAKHQSRLEHLLVRERYTQSQTHLNLSKRHKNVKNAFALAPNAVLNANNLYIIIDDVFTTGSTLNACAQVLLKAGVRHLKVATIGHG